MVRIGIVGLGFMGMIHYLAYRKVVGGQVGAVCSRDPKKLDGDWTSIQGNFGPRGTRMDLSAHARYSDFAKLLADPEVDLIDLCVPNDDHARLAIQALEAGKHVLVEKPIALDLADADRMLSAAQASGKRLMVAHVLPFFPEFAYVLEAVRSGRYGSLQAAHLMRVISKPDWSAGMADLARTGGPAVDLHIHDTHFIGALAGVPKAVRSLGVEQSGAVVHLGTQYLYDQPIAITAISGALSQPGRPFAHGYEVYLERASIFFEFDNYADGGRVANLVTVALADGTVERPDLGSGDPIDCFTAELTEAVEAVSGVAEPTRLSGALAREALALCWAEIESVRTGKAVALA